MIPDATFDAAKTIAAKTTGIPEERMLMSATHAHSAPTSAGVFQSELDADYREFLIARIAEGVQKAHAALEPARVGWGVGEDRTQVFNRRWFLKGGPFRDPFGRTIDRVRMNPPRASDLFPALSDALERERLLATLSKRLRSDLDIASVLDTATAETAAALGADRCFVRLADEHGTAEVLREWRREGLDDFAFRDALDVKCYRAVTPPSPGVRHN